MDFLAGWGPNLGATGLLLATVYAVLTGRLWPLRTVRAVMDPLREERTELRAALAVERERGDMLHRQLAEAQELGRMGARAMQALQDYAADQQPATQPTPRHGRAAVGYDQQAWP